MVIERHFISKNGEIIIMKEKFKHLTYEDRKFIEHSIKSGIDKKVIAKTIGIHLATLYREIKNYKNNLENYSAKTAQQAYEEKQKNKGPDKILSDLSISLQISKLILHDNKTVKDVIKELNKQNIKISRNTIYSAIDSGLIPNVTRKSVKKETTKVFSKGLICLPVEIKRELNIKDGDEFFISIENKKIILTKK